MLLKEKYKTYHAARKRCGFENAMAKVEYERGNKAAHYRYTLTLEDGVWRVRRNEPVKETVS